MTDANAVTKFPHHPENLPEALKVGEKHVTCDEQKVPLIAIPSGLVFQAKSTKPETWRYYDTALETYLENEHIAGIGRVIAEDEDLVGIDLDDCINAAGEVSPWAQRIVDRLGSYTEISPSLTGLKVWVYAPGFVRSHKKPHLEIYTSRRYFTITGLRYGEETEIRDASETLAEIVSEEFPRVDRERGSYQGPRRFLDLYALMERAGLEIFGEMRDDTASRKFSIRCPWVYEHTGEDDSGTYCGQYEDGALWFACWHAHCSNRTWGDFRHHLEANAYLGRGRLR